MNNRCDRTVTVAEDDVYEDEIDDIACALELSLLDLNHQNEHFGATDEASSSYKDQEDDDITRAIEKSLEPSNLGYGRRDKNKKVCDVCDEPLIRASRGEFWNQNVCPSHWWDNTPKCCGCTRFETKEVECVRLSDDRKICKDCHKSAILNEEKCRPLIKKGYKFFKSLEMEVEKYIRFYLVDKFEMARLTSQGVSSGPIHPAATVWGLTSIARDSRPIENEESDGQRMRIEVKHLEHKGHGCPITIAVLFGLPEVMTGAILAHEMMHAWLELKNVENLEAKVEEGICQVIGRKWLDWIEADTGVGAGAGDPFVKNLVEIFKHQAEMDSSEAYGEGFRDAQWAVAKNGLKTTINHIVTHGTLLG